MVRSRYSDPLDLKAIPVHKDYRETPVPLVQRRLLSLSSPTTVVEI
jgi:hypothetical protein